MVLFNMTLAYGDFKDLTRKIASDKILHDKAFNIAKNLKYDRYQRGITSINYLIKDVSAVVLKMKIFQTKNQLKYQTNKLLENFRKEKYTDLLYTIFRVLIVSIYNQ